MRMQGVTAVNAGATNDNVLSGKAFEFIKRPSKVRFYLVGDAAGELRCTVQSGAEVMLEESPISRQARFPVVPEDLTVEDIAMPGDRLVVKVRNTGAGANSLFWAVEIFEIR